MPSNASVLLSLALRHPLIIRGAGCWVLAATVAVTGCAPAQFTTATLYDTPRAFVRLEADPAVERGTPHSHPVAVSPDQIGAVLHGITIDEPITRLPIYDDLSVPRHHRAFDDDTIAFLAPLLSLGLAQATSEEVITFYLSKDRSGGRREVTSGGLFVQGEELHLVLANYRSATHYMADYGAADTTDDRLAPMRSLAPQQGRLAFEPASARRIPSTGVLGSLLQSERRELIVRYKAVPPAPLAIGAPPAPSFKRDK